MRTELAGPPGADATDAVPAGLRDGYEVHRAALSHGLDVLLLPRQVLVARTPGGRELAFVHGVPASSSLSAVTYAQDKRMRRELLQHAGLPVPPGATFAIGRERQRARRFAERIGYPVVVKPAVGDNLSEVFPGLRDEQQLEEAVEHLRTPESERPTFTRTAYGLTLLLEPDEEEGRTVAPAGYQFLIERHVTGDYLRQLVVGDRVVSAVHCPGGPAGAPGRDVTDEVHPSVREMAVYAADAVPGLAVAVIDLVLQDHTRPAPAQELWVVELSERPSLATQARISDELSRRLGEAILSHQAARTSTPLPDPGQEVSVEFRLEEAAHPEDTVTAVLDAANRAGLVATIEVTDQVEGIADGRLSGSPGGIASIFETLLDGRLSGQRAMLVEQRHHGLDRASRSRSPNHHHREGEGAARPRAAASQIDVNT
jgi:glutathione synthase/RimK-type ligase-like ATP-grasp enzyme